MDVFYRRFKQEEVALRRVINSIPDESFTEEERKTAINQSLTGISQLSNEVRDASVTLPAHDLQTYSKAIDSMTKKLGEVRTTSGPPSKFVFKRPKFPKSIVGLTATTSPPATGTPVSIGINKAHTGSSDSVLRQSVGPISKPNAGFELSSVNATHYVLNSPVSEGVSMASLRSIRGSIVIISIPASTKTSFATLTITNVEQSLLMCGAISGSAHVTGVQNSTVVIRAGQIRIHECTNVVIYLHCSSRPIIEDCKGIRFTPLPALFGNEASEEDPNCWNQVDDFKWLRAEPSPNWSVLKPDDDRAIVDESWRALSSIGSPALGVQELLKLAKL